MAEKLRCVIYCRVANATEPEQSAIELQRRKLREYAKEMGYTCTEEYLDNGYSGLDMKRPGLDGLNSCISAGQANVVLVTDPSRISRDYVQCSQWFKRMDKKGVTVFCSDVPEYAALAKEFAQLTNAAVFKKGKKKQKRHTVRTPPPCPKTR